MKLISKGEFSWIRKTSSAGSVEAMSALTERSQASTTVIIARSVYGRAMLT